MLPCTITVLATDTTHPKAAVIPDSAVYNSKKRRDTASANRQYTDKASREASPQLPIDDYKSLIEGGVIGHGDDEPCRAGHARSWPRGKGSQGCSTQLIIPPGRE